MIVPALTVGAHPFEPAGKRGVRVTSEANQDGNIDTFSQKPEDELNLFFTGFQIIERGVDAAGEDLAAGLTLEALDAVVGAITHQGVNGVVGHATVVTSGVGAGETAGRDSFLAPAPAFALGIGQQVTLGAYELETETSLAVRTIVR